jgi:hypothetical protein
MNQIPKVDEPSLDRNARVAILRKRIQRVKTLGTDLPMGFIMAIFANSIAGNLVSLGVSRGVFNGFFDNLIGPIHINDLVRFKLNSGIVDIVTLVIMAFAAIVSGAALVKKLNLERELRETLEK